MPQTRERHTEYMREYRKRKPPEHQANDKLTEEYEKFITWLNKTLDEMYILKRALNNPPPETLEHIIFALKMFHRLHSIARNTSLTLSERINLIVNFQFPEDTPSYFFNILNVIGRTETEVKQSE